MAAKKKTTTTPEPQRVMLDFRHHDALGEQVTEPLRNNLSVIKQSGRCLWVASDETDTIERLTTRDWRTFGGHTPYKLTDFFDLPVEGEVDIEGLSVDGDYLWICGSHSLKRKKPDPDEHGVEEALERLTKVECEPNRYLLGRIPLVRDGEEGIYTLCRSAPAKDGDGETLTAGRLKMDAGGANALSKALAQGRASQPLHGDPVQGQRLRHRRHIRARGAGVLRHARAGAARLGGHPGTGGHRKGR